MIYRKKNTNQSQLLQLRKLLIEKCEEIMKKGKWQYGTNEVYRDLIQYQKYSESHYRGDATKPMFIPAGSTLTLKLNQ